MLSSQSREFHKFFLRNYVVAAIGFRGIFFRKISHRFCFICSLETLLLGQFIFCYSCLNMNKQLNQNVLQYTILCSQFILSVYLSINTNIQLSTFNHTSVQCQIQTHIVMYTTDHSINLFIVYSVRYRHNRPLNQLIYKVVGFVYLS